MIDIWELEGDGEGSKKITMAGVQLMKVTQVGIVNSKSDFYEKILKVRFENESGQYHELWHYLRPSTNRRFIWLLNSLGVTRDVKLELDWNNPSEHANEILQFALTHFVGKQCKMTLKDAEYKGKKKLEIESMERYNERELQVEVKNDNLEDDDTVPF